MKAKVKPTDWKCVICGADCSFGVFAIIKGQPHCLKCFRKYRKKPIRDAPQSKSRRLSGKPIVGEVLPSKS